MGFLDAYSVRARLFPAVLAIAPALALATVAVTWNQLSLPQVVTSLAVGVLFVGFAFRCDRGHGRSNPELPGFIAGSGHHTRAAEPPTATGLPRNSGLSRCSIEAKKASMSTWMILRSIGAPFVISASASRSLPIRSPTAPVPASPVCISK